jgi:hypothetical protein
MLKSSVYVVTILHPGCIDVSATNRTRALDVPWSVLHLFQDPLQSPQSAVAAEGSHCQPRWSQLHRRQRIPRSVAFGSDHCGVFTPSHCWGVHPHRQTVGTQGEYLCSTADHSSIITTNPGSVPRDFEACTYRMLY